MTDPRMKAVPPGWVGPLDMWRRALIAAGRSRETIATRTDHLRRASRALGDDPRAVTPAALVEWVGGQVWARETRRSVYASLRGFWTWAQRRGLVDVDATVELPRVAPSPPMPRPAPEAVIEAAARDQHDRRLALIVLCAAELGMRRAEIAQVHAEDLARDLLGWTLRIKGKGGRPRDVPPSTPPPATSSPCSSSSGMRRWRRHSATWPCHRRGYVALWRLLRGRPSRRRRRDGARLGRLA